MASILEEGDLAGKGATNHGPALDMQMDLDDLSPMVAPSTTTGTMVTLKSSSEKFSNPLTAPVWETHFGALFCSMLDLRSKQFDEPTSSYASYSEQRSETPWEMGVLCPKEKTRTDANLLVVVAESDYSMATYSPAWGARRLIRDPAGGWGGMLWLPLGPPLWPDWALHAIVGGTATLGDQARLPQNLTEVQCNLAAKFYKVPVGDRGDGWKSRVDMVPVLECCPGVCLKSEDVTLRKSFM